MYNIIIAMFQVSDIGCALSASPTAFSHHLEIKISATNKLTSVLRT